MSWEGHYQNVCEQGHYFETNALMSDMPSICLECGDKVAWSHMVDDTNGCYEDPETGLCCQCGGVDMSRFQRESKQCPTCKHVEILFDVPSDTVAHKMG